MWVRVPWFFLGGGFGTLFGSEFSFGFLYTLRLLMLRISQIKSR